MLGRLLKKLFGRKGAAGSSASTTRPVSPPPPVVPAPVSVAAAPPPPPPPPTREPPTQTAAAAEPFTSAPTTERDAASSYDNAASVPEVPVEQPGEPSEESDRARVRLTLADGTTATPGLDPESEERLRYILDNIVPPPEQPPT